MYCKARLCSNLRILHSPPNNEKRLLEIDFSDTEDDIHRIFHECESRDKDDAENGHLDITPLMVACDKGNVVCLEYMQDKFSAAEKTKEHIRLKRARRNKLKTLLGNPLTDVSTTNHNSALHHAAAAGCSLAIQILQRIQTHIMLDDKHCQEGKEEEESHNKENQDEKDANRSSSLNPRTPIFLLLGSSRNNHNDTPLMMATQSLQALEFVETWYDLALKEQQSIGKSNEEAESLLRDVLQAKNDSGDSCLSLACSHGRMELVKFLVGYEEDADGENEGEGSRNTRTTSNNRKSKVEVTADEVHKCKASLDRMEQALNSSSELKKLYQSQRDTVEMCLQILEAQLEFLSARATRELLEEADDASPQRTGMASKPKRKKKKKAKKVVTAASSTTTDDPFRSESKKEDALSSVELKRLPDGKTAVEVAGKQEQEERMETSSIVSGMNASTTLQSQDASDLLRERFKGISDEVDAVMSALCLDVKCLLYSDHGMALNLSPAQLDAVQQILEKQLDSVRKARDIQQRVHEGAGTVSKDQAEP